MTDSERRKRGEELGSQKRELEQAPLELRKAAQVLTIGALFPFYYGVKFAVTAIPPTGNLDGFAQWAEGSGAFPFLAFFVAKALAMAGGWVQLQGYQGATGEVTTGIGASLGKAHKMAPVGAAAVLWLLALLIGIDQGTVGDCSRHHTLLLQCCKDLQGLLWLRALPTGADQGSVDNCIGDSTLLLHRREGKEGSLWLLALFTGADQGAVTDC